MSISIRERNFGTFKEKTVTEYTLKNGQGMEVSVINYGAIINRIITTDKDGIAGNVILGFDNMDGYLRNGNQYLGCIAGRYCNRIAHGKFSLNGVAYQLSQNNGANHLHGGNIGFDKVWWKIEKQETDGKLKLSYLSKDGEEGYPGNLNVTVIYSLTEDNELRIEYSATTDKPTPVNLTNHSYFNLSAGKDTRILNHELELFADNYIPVDDGSIPTGEVAPVANTEMDFSNVKKIGVGIENRKAGYDHNWVLNKLRNQAATLYDPKTGRYMEMFTTEPGIQFYSGNYLGATTKDAAADFIMIQYAALCLEAQHFPDSPNEPSFPNTILNPGEEYTQITKYRFSVK